MNDIYQFIPLAVLALAVWIGWRLFTRWVFAKNGIKPEPSRRRPPPGCVCEHDTGIDRPYLERVIGDVKSTIKQAEDASAVLEREGFDASAMRRLIAAALGIIVDVESRVTCTDYPFLAILVSTARHKAQHALLCCQRFDRRQGKVVIPREMLEDDGHCCCGN